MTNKNSLTKFHLLPSWAVSQVEDRLIVTGGADAKYEIQTDAKKPSFFANLQPGTVFTKQELSKDDQKAFEEFLTAEIIVPLLSKSKVLETAFINKTSPELLIKTNAKVKLVDRKQKFDIGIIVRTTETYAKLLKDINYQSVSAPHLFIDVAFHHNISVGPLVFPGETACIACLQGRVTSRWGDDKPPKRPKAAHDYKQLAESILMMELIKISSGETSLANKTVSWDLQNRRIDKRQLLKVPVCPVCMNNEIDLDGSIALPWMQDEDSADTI